LDSTTSLYFGNLAQTYARLEMYDSASSVIDLFAQRFPDNPEVTISRIFNAAFRKEYDVIEQLGYALIEEQRGRVFWEAIAYMFMGNMAAMRGQMNRAQRDWERGLTLTAERNLAGRYLDRASVSAIVELLLLDDPARARRVLDDALERYPLDSLAPLDRPYESLARAYAAAGDPERGRDLIAEFDATPEADHTFDTERERHGALGVAALAEGKFEEAIEEFRMWDDGNACATCAYPWLARVYDQLNEADSALVLYRRFVETPSSSVGNDAGHLAHAYVRIGELYEQRGEWQQAIEYYGRFVSLWENADAELQGWVNEARQTIARLSAEPRP
jgi:tetratricopeptide (TPR) repeat protein